MKLRDHGFRIECQDSRYCICVAVFILLKIFITLKRT